MSNRNIIVNTSEPKPGILGRGDLFAIAVGMVIGSGMVTLIGPAMAYTGYSVWLAYLTAIVMGFFSYHLCACRCNRSRYKCCCRYQ